MQKSTKGVIVSICICTHNRQQLLSLCLEYMSSQVSTILDGAVEVLIIDNASTDETRTVIQNYLRSNQDFRYVYEGRLGLSFARNLAIAEAKGVWISFIDDDAYPAKNYVSRLLEIKDLNYDCIGGNYLGYTNFELPSWLPKDYGNKEETYQYFTSCDFTIPCGGNVFYRKKAVIDSGGFCSNMGMKGRQLGYGEETELQYRMTQKGYKIAYDPELIVYHYIMPYKLSVLWHLQSAFASGRDGYFNKKDSSICKSTLYFMRSVASLILVRTPAGLLRLMISKKFRIQNLVLYLFQPNFYYFGRIIAQI